MSVTFKTDLALFFGTVIATAIVLGANVSTAEIMAAIARAFS